MEQRRNEPAAAVHNGAGSNEPVCMCVCACVCVRMSEKGEGKGHVASVAESV